MSKIFSGSKTVLVISLTLLMSLLFSVAVFAYPSHEDFVSDAAVILDEDTEEAIIKASEKLFESKNTRIAVCTVLTTDGESAKEYATKLFKKWDIGNGVLLLLAIDDDTYYAVQSKSISDVLTEDELSDILNSVLEPAFAEKEYSDGALATAKALSVFLSNELPDDFGSEKGGMPKWLSVILTIVLILALLVIIGYGVLVFLEKRNARRYREEMEARRRMAARGAYGNMQRGMDPRQMSRRDPRMTNRNPRQMNRDPRMTSRDPRQMNRDPRMMNRDPRQMNRDPRMANRPQQSNTGRSIPQNTQAPTIQINTADIRAAMQGRRPEDK